jgi:hypothetical protein
MSLFELIDHPPLTQISRDGFKDPSWDGVAEGCGADEEFVDVCAIEICANRKISNTDGTVLFTAAPLRDWTKNQK